jgi:drug/metabolite transporter (DMT)-like permease
MTVAAALALCSALAYGLSDFVGGLLARKTNVWAVAATSQATATVLTVALVGIRAGDPDMAALLWGFLAGLGSGAGNVLIYRGLAAGRMTVVAPLSGVTAAALPVLAALVAGERPGTVSVLGVVTALPAIWLVSGGGSGLRRANRLDVVNGLAAGAGFGVQFAALGQVSADAGLTPLALSQVVSVVAIVIGAWAASAPSWPRDRFARLGTVAGLLAGVATICFQVAVQNGPLTIAAVLAALYPAATVLCAAIVLRERIHRSQGVGLALAAAAVVLLAAR